MNPSNIAADQEDTHRTSPEWRTLCDERDQERLSLETALADATALLLVVEVAARGTALEGTTILGMIKKFLYE